MTAVAAAAQGEEEEKEKKEEEEESEEEEEEENFSFLLLDIKKRKKEVFVASDSIDKRERERFLASAPAGITFLVHLSQVPSSSTLMLERGNKRVISGDDRVSLPSIYGMSHTETDTFIQFL